MSYAGLGAQFSLQTSTRLPAVQLTAQPAQLRVQAPVLAPEVVSRPVQDAVAPEGEPAAAEPLVAPSGGSWWPWLAGAGAVGAVGFFLWRRRKR